MKKSSSITCDILVDSYCKDCGWPVISACCNDEFRMFKDAGTYDYWAYCSNKGCVNHDGEGYLQDTPEWVEQTNPNSINCEKCGHEIADDDWGWDYDDCGYKYEYIVCSKCKHREEFSH